jgi:hypothetical protein
VRSLGIDDLKKARVINPMDQNEEFHQKEKEKQMQQYEMRLGLLKDDEIQRLKRKSNYKVVREFDCGPGAKRRRVDAD